ncbi:MAG: TetR/AcrR family transcriptional regulator [Chitinophagales bacterium]
MPKKTRTPEEVQEVRQKILNMALELISEDGYDDFSMRKLAAKLQITATTIYQYYSNKDELYLAVLTRGFEELYSRMFKAYEAGNSPLDRLKDVSREYIRFGITQANFYNIMMVLNVPKFYDYVGTAAEPTASDELNTALKVWELVKQVISESGVISKKHLPMKEIATFQYACTVHGFISFCNSRMVDYLLEPRVKEIDDEQINQYVDVAVLSLEKMFKR